jgi:hypothetical protein
MFHGFVCRCTHALSTDLKTFFNKIKRNKRNKAFLNFFEKKGLCAHNNKLAGAEVFTADGKLVTVELNRNYQINIRSWKL